ncbi:MAG: SURF1 family protein [Actinomycetota bacterium]
MRTLFTPKRIISHLFVCSMVVLFVILGFWQLQRLDERKELNVEVRAAIEADPVAVEDLLGTEPRDHTAALAVGEYLDEHTFLVANRSFETQAGSWLVTPMRLDDGRIVVVSRGWVPRTWTAGNDQRLIDTPTGPIEVLGRVRSSVDDGRIGAETEIGFTEISRLDLDAVEELTGLDVEDLWIQLAVQAPPLDAIPVPVPAPGLDEGPHLSYAFQWFFFASGTIVAYTLIVIRWRRDDEREALLAADVIAEAEAALR